MVNRSGWIFCNFTRLFLSPYVSRSSNVSVSLSADIQQKDREVLELLQERVTLFFDLAEVTAGQELTCPNNCRNVFRADTPHAPQAERLLNNAIAEGMTEQNTMTYVIWINDRANRASSQVPLTTGPRVAKALSTTGINICLE